MSSPFALMITTIGATRGDVDGRMILAGSNPLIGLACFSQKIGSYRPDPLRDRVGPTRIYFVNSPRAADGWALHFPISQKRLL